MKQRYLSTAATWLDAIKKNVLIGLCIISSINAQARLHVGTKYLKLDDKPVGYVELWNSGSQTMYIAIDAYRYTVDDQLKSKQFRSRNPKELGLLYTPSKVVIKPGKKKRLRVTTFDKNLGNQHAYYRLTYNVLAKPHDEIAKGENALQGSIRIGLLHETLVDVGKSALNYKTTATYNSAEKSVQVLNKGNAIITIGPFRQCKSNGQCQINSLFTSLVPGQAFTYRLNQDQPQNKLVYDVGNYFGTVQRQGQLKIK